MDKTGTLTQGQPQVADVVALAGDRASLLQLAASVEAGSEHPLAQAVLRLAEQEQLAALPVSGFRVEVGRGVEASVAGWGVVRAGAPQWVSTTLPESVATLQAAGKTVIAVSLNGQLLGLLALADAIRPTSAQAVRELSAMGVKVIMLTGDNAVTASRVAAEAGISEFRAQVRPQDKAREVQHLREQGYRVAMVGDGVNDAPALAAADVSFAMGAPDVAVEAADVTLMQTDVLHVADAIRLSRATLGKIRQNLFFAFVYNVLGIPLAALGLLSPVLAGAAMAMSSVSVVSNSLLLRRWK
ncbi:heavy metal translocating P-type ATPase [Paludibacterium denitrificans]|uniref:heavy metal translocating P-type ATPase n=1 Tax=Paludibacterium denitrificans TaxID=2675226 RepID=UPI0028AE57CD|nr:HAD-IC family P-type ATPase [Paludibacterium denitrificans]